jgi:hypothetical protein
MYKYILAESGNINWMAMFALLTFFFMFVLTIWVVFKKSPEHIKEMEQLPLSDSFTAKNEPTK